MQNARLLTCASTTAWLAAVAVLSGCGDKCDGINCSPCDISIDNINVYIDLDSVHGGFRKADIAGTYAVRYAAPGFTAPIDTVRQARGGADFYRGVVSLRFLPWSSVAAVQAPYSLESYSFRFVLPAANRTYDLSNIELQVGPTGGDGCCDCGENKRRRFVLNGVPVVADGDGPGVRGAILRR
jgi:hypothetical protein